MKKLITTLGAAAMLFAGAVLAAVNVNTATANELQTLEGIGQVKAQAIISYRKAHDGFKSKDELGKVDGIGPATVSKIKADITVDAPKKAGKK